MIIAGLAAAGAAALATLTSPPADIPIPSGWSVHGDYAAYVEVITTPKGEVQACRVVSAGALAVVDKEICTGVSRSSFSPARDVEGSPSFGRTTLLLAWPPSEHPRNHPADTDVDLTVEKLPGSSPIHPVVRLALSVDTEGRVLRCDVVAPSGVSSLDAAACTAGPAAIKIRPLRASGGAAVASVQSLSVGFGVYPQLITKSDRRFAPLGVSGPYFPERAQRMNVGGYVVGDCAADADGRLSDCSMVEEAPIGFGFSEALQLMSRDQWIKVAPGAPRRALVRIDFPPSANFIASLKERPERLKFPNSACGVFPPLDGKIPPSLKFAKDPSGDELAEYYPPEALRAQIYAAAVLLICRVTPTGGLDQCSAPYESPPGWGFAKATRDFAHLLEIAPLMSDGVTPSAGQKFEECVQWFKTS